MKCLECGTLMTSSRENVRDPGLGLPNVVLVNLEVRHCPKCGEEEFVYPRIEELHRLLARVVINKPGHLTGDEIRFLRTHLGFSSGDFARRMGVTIEQVSRWEHSKSAMSATAERLLRLLVAYTEPVGDYSSEKLEVVDAKPARRKVAVKLRGNTWQLATA